MRLLLASRVINVHRIRDPALLLLRGWLHLLRRGARRFRKVRFDPLQGSGRRKAG